jgi:hypothetical protein
MGMRQVSRSDNSVHERERTMSAFAMADAMAWANNERRRVERQRALCSDVEQRIKSVTEYRDGLIRKRDHKASQIPLREHEAVMWARRIALADETIKSLKAELSALNQ